MAPSALVVYFIVSNLYRIGMQAYITRTLYHGEDSLGAQAQKASAEAKQLQKESGGASDALPRLGKRAKATAIETSAETTNGTTEPSGTNGAKGPNGTGKGSTPTPTPNAQNRSKKKKKRR